MADEVELCFGAESKGLPSVSSVSISIGDKDDDDDRESQSE